MSSQAEDKLPFDLEQYLSELTLQPIVPSQEAPPTPQEDERSTLMPLTLKPGGYRRLREMHRFDLSADIIKYFSNLSNVNEANFRNLNLPVQDIIQYANSEFSPYLIHNATNVINVLYRFLLRSTQTILETLDITMRDWSFKTVHRPRSDACESQSLDPILFCRSSSPMKPKSVKLVILPLGPWEFAPKDFFEFSSFGRFDDNNSDVWKSRQWVNADRMWAYLYDLCLDCDCPLFAVTSYDQWVFGRFSKYYTNAWFTPTLRFDNKPLSILEMLTYWIHASFGQLGKSLPPPVYMERKLTPAYFEKERHSHAKRFLDDGLSGMGPDLITEDLPPAKRQRQNPSHESLPSKHIIQSRASARERYRRPPRRWKELRASAKKNGANARLSLWKGRSTESVISITPSVAPSSADQLPEKMIPRMKNAWCERWRDMVAMGEEGPKLNDPGVWVDVTLQVCNPDTGSITGDLVGAADRTCPSCCPPSPTLSACSLSEEELAMWTPKPNHEDFRAHLFQWF